MRGMGEMVGITARAKCRQYIREYIRHVLSASIAQVFVLEFKENRFKLDELYSKK